MLRARAIVKQMQTKMRMKQQLRQSAVSRHLWVPYHYRGYGLGQIGRVVRLVPKATEAAGSRVPRGRGMDASDNNSDEVSREVTQLWEAVLTHDRRQENGIMMKRRMEREG